MRHITLKLNDEEASLILASLAESAASPIIASKEYYKRNRSLCRRIIKQL